MLVMMLVERKFSKAIIACICMDIIDGYFLHVILIWQLNCAGILGQKKKALDRFIQIFDVHSFHTFYYIKLFKFKFTSHYYFYYSNKRFSHIQ